jgi:hypothetical protein
MNRWQSNQGSNCVAHCVSCRVAAAFIYWHFVLNWWYRPKTAKASSKQVKSSQPNESDDVQINMIARRIEDFWPSSDSKCTKPDDTTVIRDESSKSDDVESGLLHDHIDDNNKERVAYGDLHRPKTRLSNVKTDRIKTNSSSASSMSSLVSA